MHESQRHDREWEHWPGRGEPEDGIRQRLRALFAATDEEEAIEALIDERGRELEEQAERLQATIDGLERREAQAARLRAAVEEMLRKGSAELDERQAQLSRLAADLQEREERLRERERGVALRTQELGAVELRRAAVERREQAAADREQALDAAAAEVRGRELELRDAAEELAARPVGDGGPRPREATAHRLLLADGGYLLVEREGPPPEPGTGLSHDGTSYTVVRVGQALLPEDERPLVYLERVVTDDAPTDLSS